ncbi:RnfABCDGE type electron transport complex subunit D [Merdimmobilis hominis]|jgi:electron transport complex protein RnfD|uniref:Electron transport complex protein RnfD n=1 Tax=uncultured Anaerotruncus sp. TaxID=905011 RepID=A0A6N2QVG3_9FIRM|nr:RnfABCDGE type electron transport complex subunit D [Merdimmobilis hominis]MCD4836874.1 RnfABCDGE type electron transport complex subunit D [Merdimmobilis hominis]
MKLMPSSPPHIRSQDSNATVMFYVICALGSLYFMGTFFYGMRALVLGVLSVVTCLATDLLCTRLAGRKICLWDYSSIVTGMLIPLFMPASISYWIVVAAGVFAIAVAKHPFGGLGQNIFNPAAAGIAFATVCFPVAMFTYPAPMGKLALDPVLTVKAAQSAAQTLQLGGIPKFSTMEIFLGSMPGSMGATNILLLIACLICLALINVIDIKPALAFLGASAVFALVLPRSGMGAVQSILMELTSGSLLLTAVFLLNDPATTPKRETSKIFYGVLCGVAAMLFRRAGGYEETAVFAILLMNAFSFAIDLKNESIHSEGRRRRVETDKSQKA